MAVERRLEPLDQVLGGSTGASRFAQQPLEVRMASLIAVLRTRIADELLELLDRTVDQHLRGAFGAIHRPRDLALSIRARSA